MASLRFDRRLGGLGGAEAGHVELERSIEGDDAVLLLEDVRELRVTDTPEIVPLYRACSTTSE